MNFSLFGIQVEGTPAKFELNLNSGLGDIRALIYVVIF